MVTGIFGSIDLPHNSPSLKIFKGRLNYGTDHSIQLKDIDNGQLGSVKIGKDAGHLSQMPFREFGDLIVSADVTFYNREELIRKLGIDKNADDKELLAHAYRKWEHKCIEQLVGDFAFAIWNQKKQELFCARDQMGIKPFYYFLHEKGFAFASELRILKVLTKDAITLNEEYLYDTLVAVISDKSCTAYKEIFSLPPAHYLIYKQGKIQIEKYWQLDPEQKIRYRIDDEYIAHFSEILNNAIEIRSEGGSNIGSELSGGLDSTAITCIASQYAKDSKIQFTAFSNTLPENHNTVMIDEREHIQKVLDWKEMNWCEVNELKNSIPELIEYTLNLQGCVTQQRFHMFNKGIYEAAAQSGMEVLLSGFGGDEMVSVRTGNAWNDLLSERQWNHYFQALRHQTVLPKAVLRGLKTFLKYQLKKNKEPGITSGIFTPKMLARRFGNLPLQPQFVAENHLKERYISKHDRKAELFLVYRQLWRISHQHVPQRLEYSHAAAAYYGIQYRYPLLDIKLLQTFLSFPSWMKNRPGMDRYLFRQALKGIIPEAIRLRADKTGAVIPHTYLRLKKDRELILNFIQSCSTDSYLNQIFDFSRFENWLDALLERNPDNMNYLMPGAFYNYLMILSWFTRQKTTK